LAVNYTEQRYFEQGKEIERATTFAQEFLATNSIKIQAIDLVSEGIRYMQEQYEEQFKSE
jgi:hypothetical protein